MNDDSLIDKKRANFYSFIFVFSNNSASKIRTRVIGGGGTDADHFKMTIALSLLNNLI